MGLPDHQPQGLHSAGSWEGRTSGRQDLRASRPFQSPEILQDSSALPLLERLAPDGPALPAPSQTGSGSSQPCSSQPCPPRTVLPSPSGVTGLWPPSRLTAPQAGTEKEQALGAVRSCLGAVPSHGLPRVGLGSAGRGHGGRELTWPVCAGGGARIVHRSRGL